MKGYQDTQAMYPHRLILEGMVLEFSNDGILWNPPEEVEKALTAVPSRCLRFRQVVALPDVAGEIEGSTGEIEGSVPEEESTHTGDLAPEGETDESEQRRKRNSRKRF